MNTLIAIGIGFMLGFICKFIYDSYLNIHNDRKEKDDDDK